MARTEFKVDVRGLADVVDRIHVFGTRLQQKGVKRAARAAMGIVRDDARQRARELDDETTPRQQIWKNIVVNESQRGGRRVGGVVMRVGVRGGAIAFTRKLEGGGIESARARPRQVVKVSRTSVLHPGGDTRYWRHLELGTQYMRAQAFMLPALMNNAQNVVDRLAETLTEEIDKMGAFVGPPKP